MKDKDFIDYTTGAALIVLLILIVCVISSCGWTFKHPDIQAAEDRQKAAEAKQKAIQEITIPAPVDKCTKTNTIFIGEAPACEDQ